jgi:hypothetical protein
MIGRNNYIIAKMGRLSRVDGMRIDWAEPNSQQAGIDNEWCCDNLYEDLVNQKAALINGAHYARLYSCRRPGTTESALAEILDQFSETFKRLALSGD